MKPTARRAALSQPPLDHACPFGVTHHHHGPLSREQQRAARRYAREGRTDAWLASHFGVTTRAVRRVLGPRLKKVPSLPPSPARAVAVGG